jgi:hypothetical protein
LADGWWMVQMMVRPCFASSFSKSTTWLHE